MAQPKTKLMDMNKLTPEQMADRIVTGHYVILNHSLKNDNKKLHLKHGAIAKEQAKKTVEEIVNTYGEDEWEAKSYWDLVTQEINKFETYPYVEKALVKEG